MEPLTKVRLIYRFNQAYLKLSLVCKLSKVSEVSPFEGHINIILGNRNPGERIFADTQLPYI